MRVIFLYSECAKTRFIWIWVVLPVQRQSPRAMLAIGKLMITLVWVWFINWGSVLVWWDCLLVFFISTSIIWFWYWASEAWWCGLIIEKILVRWAFFSVFGTLFTSFIVAVLFLGEYLKVKILSKRIFFSSVIVFSKLVCVLLGKPIMMFVFKWSFGYVLCNLFICLQYFWVV